MLNRFTAKPDQLEAFVAVQTAEYLRLKGRVPGWRTTTDEDEHYVYAVAL